MEKEKCSKNEKNVTYYHFAMRLSRRSQTNHREFDIILVYLFTYYYFLLF